LLILSGPDLLDSLPKLRRILSLEDSILIVEIDQGSAGNLSVERFAARFQELLDHPTSPTT
jgi:hypothetical protein